MVKPLLIILLCIFYIHSDAPTYITHERKIEIIREFNERERIHLSRQEFDRFLHDLSIRESSGNWKVYNEWGYLGLYQIGSAARIDTGYGNVTFAAFVNNPYVFPIEAQIDAVKKLIKINSERLGVTLFEFVGITIKDVELTQAGILAGAHLAGAYGVKRYLLSDGKLDPADAFGTRVSDYIRLFNDYKFSINDIYYEQFYIQNRSEA
jgi:hypothetical protein